MPIKPHTPTRSESALAIVDAECARLSAAGALAMLHRCRRGWERLFAEWQAAQEHGLPVPKAAGGASIWDFREMLDGLNARIARLGREAA